MFEALQDFLAVVVQGERGLCKWYNLKGRLLLVRG